MPDIKLGSLFDGIGVFPLAASRCGIRPVWASEIEKAPISITKRHFPDMAHLGDITKVDGGKIPPVHVITFGSPCQNLSLIGNRSGLAGAKSSLFYQAFRIIQEMRDATDNLYPAIAGKTSWERFLQMTGWILEPSYPPSRTPKFQTSIMRHTDGICVSTRAAYSLPADMWLRTRLASRSTTTGRRTYRRNTGYLPIPKRPSPSIPFSARSNDFKRPRPLRKRTRRGLPMRNGKTSGHAGPKHEGGAYHQLLSHQ